MCAGSFKELRMYRTLPQILYVIMQFKSTNTVRYAGAIASQLYRQPNADSVREVKLAGRVYTILARHDGKSPNAM